jgi:hypothetical protein
LVFLHYALRDSGVRRPIEWLAIEFEPGLYLPDWDLMLEHRRLILLALRAWFETNRDRVSGEPD